MSSPELPGGKTGPHQQRILKRVASRILGRLMRFFFYLIYQPLAWIYDAVAWTVSLGRWKSWVLCTLPYLEEQPVLELGHGPGYLQLALARGGIQVFGLDFSRQMGRLASRRILEHGYAQKLARGRSQTLPFPASSFNTVVSTFPSEYIVHPDTLAEVKRILSLDGRLVIAPLAWITGTSLPDRAARWLFRVTGEAPEWDDSWLQPFLAAGFISYRKELVEVRSSRVLVLIFKLS